MLVLLGAPARGLLVPAVLRGGAGAHTQGLTLVHVRAQFEQLKQDTFMS